MNETLRVIKNRRSIRKYKTDQIPDSVLQEIIECAIYAPNVRNRQKWHFTVVQNRSMLDRMLAIAKENIPVYGSDFIKQKAASPDYNPYYNAPVMVLITAEENMPLAEIDCGLAAQNIALAAESLNIGSCVIASSGYIFMSEKGRQLKKELGIPDGYGHVCAVLLGYKDGENPPAPPRNKETVNYVK